MQQGSCASGIGTRIEQALGGLRTQIEQDLTDSSTRQRTSLQSLLTRAAAAVLLLLVAVPCLPLLVYVQPRQQHLAAELQGAHLDSQATARQLAQELQTAQQRHAADPPQPSASADKL